MSDETDTSDGSHRDLEHPTTTSVVMLLTSLVRGMVECFTLTQGLAATIATSGTFQSRIQGILTDVVSHYDPISMRDQIHSLIYDSKYIYEPGELAIDLREQICALHLVSDMLLEDVNKFMDLEDSL